MTSRTRRALLLTALACYSIVVFLVDAIAPLGIEVWVLNLPVLLVPILFRNTGLVVAAGVVSSLMLLAGSFFSPPGNNPLLWDITNRVMGLATIWLIAGMAINTINRDKQLDAAVSRLQREIAHHQQTSRSLERSEERLRLAVEGVGMGTFDVNVQTGTVYCSMPHLRMLGYENAVGEPISVDIWRSHVYPDDQPRLDAAKEYSLQNRSLYSVEYRVRRADTGDIVWLKVFGRWYYNAAGEAVRFLGVSFDVTQRKELEGQLLEITAQTQRRIGQELHDGVGQEITGLGLMAQALSKRLPENSSDQRVAIRLVAGLKQLHEQIRALARGLVPVEIEAKGLWAALDDLAASTREQSGLAVTLDCPEMIDLPDHAVSMELYRIAQEAVSNALRHGRPRRIPLSLVAQPSNLRLRIEDDGAGIGRQPPESKGLGLRIMEYRAALIGGVLSITPGNEGGTVVTVTLPWRHAHDHAESEPAVAVEQNPDCR